MKKKVTFVSLVLAGLLLSACTNYPCNCGSHAEGVCPTAAHKHSDTCPAEHKKMR